MNLILLIILIRSDHHFKFREDDFLWSLDSSRCPGDSLCRVCRVDLVLSYAHWAPVQLASVSHDGDVSDPEVVALSSKVIMLYSKFSSKQGVCSKWQQGVFAQQEVVLQGGFAQRWLPSLFKTWGLVGRCRGLRQRSLGFGQQP